MACPDLQPMAPWQLYLSDVVSAQSWCSTAAPGALGTARALPALAQILGSAHTPVFPLLPAGLWRGQDHLDVTSAPPCMCGQQTRPVRVSGGLWRRDPAAAPGWEPARSAQPCLPRAASCAINDKAAAEVCVCAGSLSPRSVPVLGQRFPWVRVCLPGWGLCSAQAPGP